MAEKLLDRAQIGAALEQVGSEGVPQRVGRDAGPDRRIADPAPQAAAHIRGREPAATAGQQQRLLFGKADEQGRASRLEIALQGALSRLSDRQQPLLSPLSEDPDLLADYLGPDTIGFVEWPDGEAELAGLARIAARVTIEHAGDDRRVVDIR